MIKRSLNATTAEPAITAALARGYGLAFDAIAGKLERGVIITVPEAARLCRHHVDAQMREIGHAIEAAEDSDSQPWDGMPG